MKNSSKSDFLIIDKPLDATKFKVGELVWVAYNVESQKDWRAGWNREMGGACGKRFEVLDVNRRDGYRLKTNKVAGMTGDYWFPDGALKPQQVFRVGDLVRVTMYPERWDAVTTDMRPYVGTERKVTNIDGDFIMLDGTWNFPPYALESLDPKTKSGPEAKLGPHDPNKFPVGSKVRIVREVLKQKGWENSWNTSDMSVLVGDGKTYIVTETGSSGYRLKDQMYGWPSGALGAAEEGVKVTLVIEKGGKKKRRVRVGPGPWDAAPCTHLRWHLMGFFREKLAFKKTKTMVKAPLPDGTVVDVEADIASVQVVCTKCGTSMTLNAK